MPSWELFEQQDEAYRDRRAAAGVTRRVAVEQASTLGWERYTGLRGAIIGMKTFGASAPLKELLASSASAPNTCYAAAKAAARPQGVTAMANPLQDARMNTASRCGSISSAANC